MSGALAAAVGPLIWNAILRTAHGDQFFTYVPVTVFRPAGGTPAWASSSGRRIGQGIRVTAAPPEPTGASPVLTLDAPVLERNAVAVVRREDHAAPWAAEWSDANREKFGQGTQDLLAAFAEASRDAPEGDGIYRPA
ncbi:hypothetical protein ACWEQC_26075 [Streptomyces shenzhenensis]